MDASGPIKVFISYTMPDREFAERLATDIESFGLGVWIDRLEIRLGDSITERIQAGIQQSQWMIVVLSPAAMQSGWVEAELRAGLAREIGSKKAFVLPVLLQDVELPVFLQDKFYADFTGDYEVGLRLVKDRLLGRYGACSGDQWLLVRNPLPRGLRDALSQRLAGSYYDLLANVDEQSLEAAAMRLRTLTGGNIREQIALVREAMAPPSTPTVPKGADLWFGRTGRLIVRSDGNHVFGDYDWHGMSLAGQIEGRRREGCIVFSWGWNMSSERGRGLFWTDVPNVLYGGWWMDYDFIDEDAVRSRRSPVPSTWEFVSVRDLTISSGEAE